MTALIDCFPLETPRAQQTEIMLKMVAYWNSYDVFVIQAPPATGKAALAVAVAQWQASLGKQTTIGISTNVLVEQMCRDYPQLAPLHRKDFYKCGEMGSRCVDVKKACGHQCTGCVYTTAKKNFADSKTRIANYYTYAANKAYSEVVIFDEAHLLIDIIQDRESMLIWGNKYAFPRNIKTTAELLEWIEDQKPDEKLAQIRATLLKFHNQHLIEYTNDFYRGASVPVLKIKPIKVRTTQTWMWPAKVKKLVLMSATISAQDICEMGLDKRRVVYIDVDSPIPSVNRPINFVPVANVTHQYKERSCKLLAEYIEKMLAVHPEKGLIHLPYSWVDEVMKHIKNPRVLTHTRNNKNAVLTKFRAGYNGVLMASGLYEGLDLPFDEARWQIIGKVPYKSLGEPAIAERATVEPEWYAYAAIRKIVQAAGRVCRTPDDHGVTYVVDSQFERLFRNNKKLFPRYFTAALRGMNV